MSFVFLNQFSFNYVLLIPIASFAFFVNPVTFSSSLFISNGFIHTCVQYIHGLAARGVHYLHRPGPTLQDLGFMLLPVCAKTFVFGCLLVYCLCLIGIVHCSLMFHPVVNSGARAR